MRATANKSIKRDISELTPVEKLLLQVTHPELYNSWFGSSTNKIPEGYSPFDFLNFDLPTLALQLSKSDGALILPSLNYTYGFYFCYIGVCSGVQQDYDYRNPEVVNANLTSLNTKINSTNIELDFKIPDLQIIIDNFTLSDTDLVSGATEYWKGFSLTITNYTLQLSADLEYVQDVGIQVSNVAMNFDVDDFRTLLGYEEGNVVETQYAEQMMEEWVEVGADFVNQRTIDCYINTNKTKDEMEIRTANSFWMISFKTENFVQLLQTFGLSILRSQEVLDRNVVAETKKEEAFLNFLPHLPTPTINSILLEYSTLMLQLGKFFYDPDHNLFPVVLYTLSYDNTWENCTDGVCRNINHKMILPCGLMATKEVYLGLQLSIWDNEFALSGKYELKEGVGLQVSDLGITLRLGKLQFRVPRFYTVENGEQSELQEYKVDAAPQIMEMWSSVDQDGAQNSTGCVKCNASEGQIQLLDLKLYTGKSNVPIVK
ncbi:hypothetical protein Ocin01_11948 [Orchesella cincta]|uniref:Uncharacterized protein n=1 Tax=Orchesella cincta TaxID=48709 RepID=A0A1D2MPE2_ORCCI|nr:hypothetical protein Ocin01_11948 [Orchesella cincta]